jgi:hypothetical protein
MRLGLALVALALAACFTTDTFVDGELACSDDPNRPCPGSAVCIQGACWHHPDLGIADLAGLSGLSDLGGD